MSKGTMKKFKIGNHWVHFPFVPYEPQERFMQKMIMSMDNEQNALLESPTGTGKTACLLNGSLAWLDSIQLEEGTEVCEKKYKIFFTSRTHSQLKQAMQEFNTSSYVYMKSAVLSARKHLCLHPSAKKDESKLDAKCKSLRRPQKCEEPIPDIEDLTKLCTECGSEHQCPYYVNFETRKNRNDLHEFTKCGPLDQVRLKEKCEEYKVCPFYVSRHLVKQADIIFLPYSYVFNPHILRVMQLPLRDSILIVDEGHNIERVCEENASFEMKLSDIVACRKELSCAKEYCGYTDFPNDAISFRNILELEDMMEKLRLKVMEIVAGKSYDGQHLLQQFLDVGFSYSNRHHQLEILDQLIKYCGDKADKDCKNDGMKKIHNVISTLFYLEIGKSDDGNKQVSVLKESFVLYKEKLSQEDLKKDIEPKIYFWCFDAGVIMKSLEKKGVRSFIVTSGTLSPLGPLRDSLGIPFDVDLINDHVIDNFQVRGVCVRSVPMYKKNWEKNVKEVSEIRLTSSYSYRRVHGKDYYAALGEVVLEVVSATPKGVLIFFTSSEVKEQCLKRWDEVPFENNDNVRMSLYDAINKQKVIFTEPKLACNLNDLQRQFNKKIDDRKSNGACLIGVMSGKVSEGIDFKDDYGRAVIMIGIPFLPIFDQWVIHKKKAVEEKRKHTGRKDWELAQAIRPVNQALGRIIRHRRDFGVVVLPDTRYVEHADIRRVLPKWLKSNLSAVPFENLKLNMQEFFSSIPSKMEESNLRADQERDNMCSKHENELKNEEIPADQYHELIQRKKTEMSKGKQLEMHLQELRARINEKRMQIEKLKLSIKEETPQDLNQESMVKMKDTIEMEDDIEFNLEDLQKIDQEIEADYKKILMKNSSNESSESEDYYDSDGGESEWENLDLPSRSQQNR